MVVLEIEEEAIEVRLCNMVNKLPEHQFFYRFNKYQSFDFERREDMIVGSRHRFSVFTAQSNYSYVRYIILINNQIFPENLAEHPSELFHFIDHKNKINENVDMVIFTEPFGDDLSGLVMPESLIHSASIHLLNPEDPIYTSIINYKI